MSVSLRDERRWFARTKLRRYRSVRTGVQLSPPYGAYTGTPNGTDAQRSIVSSDLASLSIATDTVEGEDVRPDWHDGMYTYVLDRGMAEQRRISLDGYTQHADASSVLDAGGATQVGYLLLERNLGRVPPPGTLVEIHAHPPLDADGFPGLHTFILQALKAQRAMTRRLTFAGLSTQQAYEVTSYGITSLWQLGQVLGTSGTGMEPYSAPGAATIRSDGERTYLVFRGGAPPSGDFWADVWLPRDAWVLSKRTAAATVTVAAGAVTGITLDDAGVGYSGTATVAISGAGTGATATATVLNGAVTGFTVTAGGAGYVSGTTIAVISAPTSTTYAISTVGPENDEDEFTGEINETALIAHYHYWAYRAEMDERLIPRAQKAALIAAPFMEHAAEGPVNAWGSPSYGRGPETGGAGSDWFVGGGGRGVPTWP